MLIAGVGRRTPRALLAELGRIAPDELVFAEAQSGDRFALDAAGRVLRYDPGAEERALAGTDFGAWLDATVAREQILFGPDGEYAPDVFDRGGEEVVPPIALRQAERALKIDPGRCGRPSRARARAARGSAGADAALAAFAAATELDADNPWPWFDLGRTALALGRPAEALAGVSARGRARARGADRRAPAAPGPRAAAAAGDAAAAGALRAEALARDPALVDGLIRAAASAAAEGEEEGSAEELALLEAVAPGTPVPRRLPVIRG